MTKTVTLEKPTQTKSGLVDDLKNFAASQPPQTPGNDQQPPGESPQGQTLNEGDFLNTGDHAKTGAENNASGANTANTAQPIPGTQQKTSNVLGNSGKLAVTLVHDTILPALFVWVCAMFKKELEKDSLKLTKEDREILIPAWQDYLNSVNISFEKPIYQLLVAIGFTYGAKFMDGTVKIKDKRAPVVSASEAITKVPDVVTRENFQRRLRNRTRRVNKPNTKRETAKTRKDHRYIKQVGRV
jgi:hypothetical protein